MMNSVAAVIRPAFAEDTDGIVRLYFESAELHKQLDPERHYIPDREAVTASYRERSQPQPGPADRATLVAELDGVIVGFVDAQLQRSSDAMHLPLLFCHIAEIAVANRHRYRGIGRALLRGAEDWGRLHGAEFSSLEYNASNKDAAVFYQHMGYQTASITAIRHL
jgi:GNAT superfamily N-acetyltransferase